MKNDKVWEQLDLIRSCLETYYRKYFVNCSVRPFNRPCNRCTYESCLLIYFPTRFIVTNIILTDKQMLTMTKAKLVPLVKKIGDRINTALAKPFKEVKYDFN